MGPALSQLVVGDDPSAWQAAGFAVDASLVTIGGVTIRLVGTDDPRGRGVVAWSFHGLDGSDPVEDIDGIPVATVSAPAPPSPAAPHPNGVIGFDHVVVISPNLDRTIARLESRGIEARRTREVGTADAPRRQVFFWVGEVILELVGPVEPAGDGAGRIYGLALTVDDIDGTADHLGERVGRVKDAVQPGRRITTLRHKELGMSVPVAFMSAHVRADDAGA
jgi:hypothetical protein